MREAVENLGGDVGGDSVAAKGHQMTQLANLQELTKMASDLIKQGFLKGNFGGGGRIRTADAADMSRVL